MDQSVNWGEVEKQVFHKTKAGDIYIGGHKISAELKAILKDQARNFRTTNLFDIFNATIINESSNIALIQSTEYSHVECAKMLFHWNFVLKNMVDDLAND